MSELPVLLLVAVVFAVVVFATMKKVHLGLAALGGGLVFAFIRGIPPVQAVQVGVAELLEPENILLLILVTLIMILSGAMKKSGAMVAFARAVRVVAPGPRASLAVTPLLIGTLPMPGGALFSAPLVDALDSERRQGAETLSAINYWFRHSLELTWPLYPAFILTTSLAGITTARLSLLNLYSLVLLIFLGQTFIIRGSALPKAGPKEAGDSGSLLSRLEGFAPLAIVLTLFFVLTFLAKAVVPFLGLSDRGAALLSRYLPTLGGILGAMAYVAITRGVGAYRGTLTPEILKMAGVIAGVRVFSALLEAGGIGVQGAAELAAWNIPPVVVACLMPLIAGLVTGVGFAYVGIAFPIVLGLFPEGGSFPREVAVVLSGAFGYAGMMLSPLHVCLVVTVGHFKTSSPAVLRRMILPLALFLLAAVAYATLLSAILR